MSLVKLIKFLLALVIIFFAVNLFTLHFYRARNAGIPPGWDFIQHYSAAVLAMHGQASHAYNFHDLAAVESSIAGFKINLSPYYLLWNYPPSFLLVIMPLSLLPYKAALLLWLGVFFLAFLAILYRLAPHPLTWWFAIAFPANYWNFLHCQNGFFFGTMLGAGLWLLNRKPLVSGILLGLVTCKPHLALIIPLALIAGRRWRALASMVSTALVLVLGSALVFGLKTWQAFLDNSSFVRRILESGAAPGHKSPSVFAAARMLAAGVTTAYGLQMVAAVMAIGVVCYIWRRRREPEIANPILVLGILLSTPYLLVHDLTFLAIPLAYFTWQNYDKNLKVYEVIILILAWSLPLYSPSLALLTHLQVGPVIFLALMMLILERARHAAAYGNAALPSPDTHAAGSRLT
jgi:alpha-1,2-mannosyltransferase